MAWRLVIITALAVTINGTVRAQQSALKDTDKAAIIRAILEDQVNARGPEEFDPVLLESDGIKASMAPKIEGTTIKLLRRAWLVRAASKTPSGIQWSRFGTFEFDGITVKTGFASFRYIYSSRKYPPVIKGKSYEYIFRKVNGEWQGKVVWAIC